MQRVNASVATRIKVLVVMAVLAVAVLGIAAPASAGWDWYCESGEMCLFDTDPWEGAAGNWNSDNHYDGDALNNYESVNNNVNYVYQEDVCYVAFYQHGNWNNGQAGWSQWVPHGYWGFLDYQNQASSHLFFC